MGKAGEAQVVNLQRSAKRGPSSPPSRAPSMRCFGPQPSFARVAGGQRSSCQRQWGISFQSDWPLSQKKARTNPTRTSTSRKAVPDRRAFCVAIFHRTGAPSRQKSRFFVRRRRVVAPTRESLAWRPLHARRYPTARRPDCGRFKGQARGEREDQALVSPRLLALRRSELALGECSIVFGITRRGGGEALEPHQPESSRKGASSKPQRPCSQGLNPRTTEFRATSS